MKVTSPRATNFDVTSPAKATFSPPRVTSASAAFANNKDDDDDDDGLSYSSTEHEVSVAQDANISRAGAKSGAVLTSARVGASGEYPVMIVMNTNYRLYC